MKEHYRTVGKVFITTIYEPCLHDKFYPIFIPFKGHLSVIKKQSNAFIEQIN